MKVSYIDSTDSKVTLEGKKKPLLKFLSSLVHVLGTAKASGLVPVNDNIEFHFPGGITCKETTQYICCDVSELPALKAARRAVAAKVLGVPSV